MQGMFNALINTHWCVPVNTNPGMTVTIILGEMFKASMPSYNFDFTRFYPHRAILKKISSNILVSTKTGLPNRVYIFNTTGSPKLCSSPTWLTNIFISSQGTSSYWLSPSKNHKFPAEHLQNKIKHQNHKGIEIYFLNKDNINHIHISYGINILIHCLHYLIMNLSITYKVSLLF